MSLPYTETKEISYYITNHRLMLTKANLAVILQDNAINHSDYIGYSLNTLLKLNKGWIITNWHIIMNKMPLCGQKISVTTWSDGCKRYMANRSYTIADENGNIMAKAASRWVYMDLGKRKPEEIPQEMKEKYRCNVPAAIENEKFKMPLQPEISPYDIFDVSVSRSQTDTNAHTNNTQYIAWAMDRVPDELYNSWCGYDMRVIYRKESYRNDVLRLKTYITEENGEKLVNTFVVSSLDESIIHAQIATLWRKESQ